MSTKLHINTLKRQHHEAFTPRHREVIATYRFYSVLSRHPPVASNALQLLHLRAPSFVDYDAFCAAVKLLLCQLPRQRQLNGVDCQFLAWFDKLTSDCGTRVSRAKRIAVLWGVFQTLLRRLHCSIESLEVLHRVESDGDYYRAACTFVNSLDHQPLAYE